MRKYLLAALAILVGCATAPKSLDNIPLVWKPEKQQATAAAAPVEFFKAKVKVAPMTDGRKDAALIGENREQTTARPVTTSDNVAAFVTEHFKTLLSGAGMTVVDSEQSATIKGDIQQFFVTETSEYAGDVRIHIVVTNSGGKTLWEGMTSGSSTRFGRSYRAENYYETYSDALTVAASNLMQQPGFQAAVAHK